MQASAVGEGLKLSVWLACPKVWCVCVCVCVCVLPSRQFQTFSLFACKEMVGQEASPAQKPSLLAETFLLVTAASFGPGGVGPQAPTLSSANPALSSAIPRGPEPPTPADILHLSLCIFRVKHTHTHPHTHTPHTHTHTHSFLQIWGKFGHALKPTQR